MEVKILDIKRENKVGKTSGRAFISLRLKTEQYPGKWMSGFGGDENSHWKVGDTVEVEVETKGEYLNFKTLKMNPTGQGDTARVINFLEFKVMPALQFLHEDVKALRKKLIDPDYTDMNETNDASGLEPDDQKIPF